MTTNPRTAAVVAAIAAILTAPSIGVALASGTNHEGGVTPNDPVDTEAPRVVEVFGIAGEMIMPLAEFTSVNHAVESLVLRFSEPMWNPPGDETPHDVTNAASYMVLATGPYRGVATSSCSEPWIDETIVPILNLSYDPEEFKVQLDLDLSQIADVLEGQYRLILCDEGATDPAGNAVDGLEPQVVENQMWRTYRVDSESRFSNGHFDCDVDGWVPLTGMPEDWAFDAADVNWAVSSGSGVLDNLSGAPSVAVGQCVVMSGSDRMRFGAKAMLAQAVDETVEIHLTCSFYSAASCGGVTLGEAGASWTVAVNEDGWTDLGTEIIPVAGTSSAGCAVVAVPLGAPTPVTLDEVTLSPLPMFSDDFEMANFSRWSDWHPFDGD